jgi:PrtD family type I secretion system ABC transporter
MTSPSERAAPARVPTPVNVSAKNLKPTLIAVAVFGGATNVLALTGSMFMLEIYDRVVPSKSVPTLVAFLLLAIGFYSAFGLLDVVRSRLMTRLATMLDSALSPRVFRALINAPLSGRPNGDALRPSQELDQIRSFLSGPGPLALFDLPWMPIYLGLCFLLHPLIGWLTSGAMAVLVLLSIANDLNTRSLTKSAIVAAASRNLRGETAHRTVEAITTMGMERAVMAQWIHAHSEYVSSQRRAADIGGTLSSTSKAVRYALQSAALGLGAYLAITGQISSGMIVASSIVVARAVAPIEQVIAQWRSMLAAWQAWVSLNERFSQLSSQTIGTAPPFPHQHLSIESVSVSPPGQDRLTVRNVSFGAKAGTVIGILGSSASGKSSLVRAIVGAWQPSHGHVRIDGASLDQWPSSERGRFIGYVPQSVDLLDGSIAENISRFDNEHDEAAIIRAAEAAGVHKMVVRLPGGYEYRVGEGGRHLSAGQRQRIALARALYKDPFLVVMDEPNSNLDNEGDQALAEAIANIRQRGGITILVAHRRSVLSLLDSVLFMEDGFAKAFGPRDAVLKSLEQRHARVANASRAALAVIDGDGA